MRNMRNLQVAMMTTAFAFIGFGARVAYDGLNTSHENDLLMENVEALAQLEAVVGRTPTPGSTTCTVYQGDSLVQGKKSVCEQAAPLNKSCIPDICMIPRR